MQRDIQSRMNFVIIGIDQYRRWPTLHHAVGDATGAAQLFEQLGCVQACEPVLNGAATRDALHRLATVDLAHLTADDSLVVFFSGHGHTHTAEFTDVSVKTGYVIPVDGAQPDHHAAATWLRLDSWLSDIARLAARHILVIIDAGHGGVALGDLYKWRDDGSRFAGELDTLRERRSRRVIVSALDDQRAMNPSPYPGRSLFAGCLLDGLSGGLATPGRSATTGRELGQYLRMRVATYAQSAQTPDCGAFELDDGGDIELPVLSPAVVSGEADGVRPRPPASHPRPRAVLQAPRAEPAAPPESSPPGPVGMAAPTLPGAPAGIDRVTRPGSIRHGVITIGLVILGIGAALGYTVTTTPAIAVRVPATPGPAAAPGGASAPREPAGATGASTAPREPVGATGGSTAGTERDRNDPGLLDYETAPSRRPSYARRGQAAAKPVAAEPSKVGSVAASDEVTRALQRRNELKAQDEKRILEHIDKQLVRPRHDERHFSYRILRGQLFLLKLMRSAGLPVAEYLPSLRGYVDNQLALIKEMQLVQSTRGLSPFLGFGHFAAGDEQLAKSVGVQQPGHYPFLSPHVAMRDLAGLLAFGTPPFFDATLPMRDEDGELDMSRPEPICYYKLDHDLTALVTRLLDEALGEIAAHEGAYEEREAVDTLQQYAHVYLALGQPKQAVAKLQTILTSYPRSEEFTKVQRELEDLSNGEVAAPTCRDPS